MTEEYFTLREGIATYLCRKTEEGCFIIAQKGLLGKWIKLRKPQFWKWCRIGELWTDDPEAAYHSRRPLGEQIPISREEVTAILLMGKRERDI